MKPHGMLIAVIVLAACADSPTGPTLEAAAFARNSGPSYVFTDWQGHVWSTGPILADISPDGRFNVQTGGSGRNEGPELCVNLSQLGGVGIADQATYDLFVQRVAADPNSNGLAQVCSEATMHTRDHSNAEQSGGQTIGAVEHAGGKIVLKDFASSKGAWEWRLTWDVEGPLMDDPERGKGICIQRATATTWYVYNDDDVTVDPPGSCNANGVTVDNVARLIRVFDDSSQKGKPVTQFVLAAEFLLPFGFRAEEQ